MAGDPVRQGVAFEVITTVTASLLLSVDDVKVSLPVTVPALLPFTFHWYDGVVPPLTGVAVNWTDVPAQMAPAGDAAMLTLA